MFLLKRLCPTSFQKLDYVRRLYSGNKTAKNNLCKYFEIPEVHAQYLTLKHRGISQISPDEIENLIDTVYHLGYNRSDLIDQPNLFGVLPVTLKHRHEVLQECGFSEVKLKHLASFLRYMKAKTIGKLKEENLIPPSLNVENKLASCMTCWPSSLTTLVYGDSDTKTLSEIRLSIIQRYLELSINLNEDKFKKSVERYPTIKHRPLAHINETLTLLLSVINMPVEKIHSNFFLVHSDPDNLKKLLFQLKNIAGVDIKEIIRYYPRIAVRNYDLLVKIRNILSVYGVGDDAQRRCLEIYTLSPETILERLKTAKNIPEFEVLSKHPRFLRIIYHNKSAMERLETLYKSNKKCSTLNILSGGSARFKNFEKAPGDRHGKGKDLLFCLKQNFGSNFTINDIRNHIKRHPYWVNVPVVQVKLVFEKLAKKYKIEEIYENCTILLYPWEKVRQALTEVNNMKKGCRAQPASEQINYSELSQSQVLSLALYNLEKSHYFTGNGVWTEEQIKQSFEIPTIVQELSFNATKA